MDKEIIYKVSVPEFGKLFSCFQEKGYTIVGPTIKDQAIVYSELDAVSDLPIGWTDDQGPGFYRIK